LPESHGSEQPAEAHFTSGEKEEKYAVRHTVPGSDNGCSAIQKGKSEDNHVSKV
jgi:hypothetical protein